MNNDDDDDDEDEDEDKDDVDYDDYDEDEDDDDDSDCVLFYLDNWVYGHNEVTTNLNSSTSLVFSKNWGIPFTTSFLITCQKLVSPYGILGSHFL